MAAPPLEMETRETIKGLKGLYSDKSSLRMEQIAQLRARGVGNHVDLPQLVVCGDQSAGKSSVLEGLTQLPFPRQDGVCTKFPTEIILQQSLDNHGIVASIIPAATDITSQTRAKRAFKRQLDSLEELPEVIQDAGEIMGIRGFGDLEEGPAFSKDVLRIEVSSSTSMQLTVVDLPGLIEVSNEEQTDDDVKLIHELVEEYISKSRTIILAVVQAGIDIANQKIIQKSKLFDSAGQRTVGIITKPDLINEGSEKRIALLATNKSTTKLKLGYFLVKNPTPFEMEAGISTEERQENEVQFFQATPWNSSGLDIQRVGVVHLRKYLTTLLDKHVERELPKVRAEIKVLMQKTWEEIISLGNARPTLSQMRIFLTRLGTHFTNLVMSASNGTYREADFTFFATNPERENTTRLRALVHACNEAFARQMREKGARRKVQDVKESHATTAEAAESGDEDIADSDTEEPTDHEQLVVTEKEMIRWVQKIYSNSRGKELPGDYNHVFLSELFTIQSSRWEGLAKEHVTHVHDIIARFVRLALAHITSDGKVIRALEDITCRALQANKQAADAELDILIRDEGQQPMTYNHYYTDNIQKQRHDIAQRKITTQAKLLTNKHNFIDLDNVPAMLERSIMVDMKAQACTEALLGLQAYYKVAMKTFVDNVCRQVVERHLMRSLPSAFTAEEVAGFDDAELSKIASESPEILKKRLDLTTLHENLQTKDTYRPSE